ncbi:MAG: hypothetical protein UY73_C0010G0006 [Parcubacteria group bacterium GW2011_GWA2_52_8]|nr:MAG: hypothetical protein UY73_C0010G0006 [Parcubacteria group bacterium GW2011_GWA2_52_8]
MRSPAAAIAWEFRRPHRWALVALAGYMLVVGAFKLMIIGPGHVRLDPPNGVAAVVLVPFSTTFMYFLAVFSFGFGGLLLPFSTHSVFIVRAPKHLSPEAVFFAKLLRLTSHGALDHLNKIC